MPGVRAERQGARLSRAAPRLACSPYVAFYQEGVKVLEPEPLAAEVWDPTLRAVPIRFTLQPGQIAPGTYDCQVTVLDPSTQRAAFLRSAIVITR